MPHPVNWRTLTAEDAEYEWLALNEWVDWLRHEFGLPAAIKVVRRALDALPTEHIRVRARMDSGFESVAIFQELRRREVPSTRSTPIDSTFRMRRQGRLMRRDAGDDRHFVTADASRTPVNCSQAARNASWTVTSDAAG